jgi:hypothetical protein
MKIRLTHYYHVNAVLTNIVVSCQITVLLVIVKIMIFLISYNHIKQCFDDLKVGIACLIPCKLKI